MYSVLFCVISFLYCFSFATTEWISNDHTIERSSSVSGVLVMCYDDEEICMKECFFTCHPTDHCNDSLSPKVACFPHLSLIVLLTFAFILFVVCCCCCICIVGPILLCYKSLQKWQRKRRNRRMFV
uniref:Uncharacterized protein n=2 Tax=Wuchereria bancrofti TaxID=6293 RepID=A0AAF5Q4U3_WUCBA